MGGVEECGLARAQVFHAAPGSLFSAAQNSLSCSSPFFFSESSSSPCIHLRARGGGLRNPYEGRAGTVLSRYGEESEN